MSGQLRTLKNRIRGVENTQKITRAMEMVAASKLKRFQKLREQATPYVEALEGILKRLLATGLPLQHPLLEPRAEKKTALLVITSDTGLCGSYNQNLIEEAKNFLQSRLQRSVLVGVGKSGVNALLRAGHSWHQTFTDTKITQLESVMTETASLIEALFTGKRVDAVYVIYTRVAGRSVFRATTEKLLPLRLEAQVNGRIDASSLYIMEPSHETLFARLVPMVLAAQVRMIFMESQISEHTARMNAMYQATENAKELTDALVLLRNKVRQAAITREIIEIVSGSKALKN